MNFADELNWRPATELARLIRRKALSPVELLQAHLETIARPIRDITP
jgi:Asp-tRNA(Asn)/Glu-tRNA(Gln) amidotransferase A subunit family amidase